MSVQSLSGHTSPVDAVKFSNSEDMVIAGSLSGALKIWDLESVKSMHLLVENIDILLASESVPVTFIIQLDSTTCLNLCSFLLWIACYSESHIDLDLQQ